MKKTLVSGLCMAILCFSACRKETETVAAPRKKSSGSTSSAGQIHNRGLSEYLDSHGSVSDPQISIDEAYAEMLALAEISKANGFLPGRSADDLAGAALTYQIESGYFENGHLKPTDAIHALVLQKVENPAIRSAIRQIDALAAEDDADFVDDSRQILARLELIDARERDLVEGFGSVLGDSYVLWDGRRPQSANTALKNAQIALADAIGWVDGFLWAGYCRNWDPKYYREYLYEASWFAEVASARAAKK